MAYANRSKSAQQSSGVFISYARSDGEAYAHWLRHQLEKQNIKLWQDRVGMEGGRDWWLQITEALDNVAFMALVVTPNASSSVLGCAFSPDGKLIVSASDDYRLKVWDSETGRLLRTLEGHSSYVRGCAFSPDGKLIVSASDDNTLKVWDAETGQTLATFFADGSMFCCVVNGEMVAAGGAHGVYFLRLVR
jgi:WD40 repeat protein